MFQFHQCIFTISQLSPLGKGGALHLNKLKYPLPRDTLFCRRRFLKVVNLYLLFSNHLPFRMGVAHHLNILESLSPRDTLCQVWLKLAQLLWRRRWKCEKFTDRQTDRRTNRRTDGQTDDGRHVIRKAHLSFQISWGKNKTGSPWATSLTWETNSNQWIYLSKVMLNSIYIIKLAQ